METAVRFIDARQQGAKGAWSELKDKERKEEQMLGDGFEDIEEKQQEIEQQWEQEERNGFGEEREKKGLGCVLSLFLMMALAVALTIGIDQFYFGYYKNYSQEDKICS